jgi:hypothetical protein
MNLHKINKLARTIQDYESALIAITNKESSTPFIRFVFDVAPDCTDEIIISDPVLLGELGCYLDEKIQALSTELKSEVSE